MVNEIFIHNMIKFVYNIQLHTNKIIHTSCEKYVFARKSAVEYPFINSTNSTS